VRLCVVTEEFPPVTEYYGGIGTQYGRLLPELARRGHEMHVVTLAPQRQVEPVIAGVHVHVLERGRVWPWYAVLWSRQVRSALSELGPFDAIVSPEFRGELSLYAAEQSQGPLVTHLLTSLRQLLAIRPGLTWIERNGVRARVGLRLEQRQAENSAALLAPGQAVLDWARSLWNLIGIPARILPLTIGVQETRDAARSGEPPPGFPARGPVVTFASRMDGHKGTQYLVPAMKEVWRVYPEAQVVFVGRDARWNRGWMSDHLRELAGPGEDRLHVLGGQPPAAYFAAVAASDVVAIPSLWESYCLAAVEAMALGVPVVGTSGHGFSEFIEHDQNGLLVERHSVDELADALLRVLGDGDVRARMGAAARATADRHDPRVVAPLYEDALRDLPIGNASRNSAGTARSSNTAAT
jgi:glycosyltransferase involved in cell wall biosynthesis